MDIELLFSRNPFVQGDSKQFANILPNKTQKIKLPAGASNYEFPLPDKLLNSNVLVEIVGAGQTQSKAYYSNALRVQNRRKLRRRFGSRTTRIQRRCAKVYVKVYARMKDGNGARSTKTATPTCVAASIIRR